MKTLRLRIYVIIGLIFTGFPLFGQKSNYNPTKKFTVEELQEDFTVFRNKLENNLANLYLYNSVERINFIFDSLYQNIDKPMTDMEFYAYITQTISIVKDGHNYIYPDPVVTHYFNKTKKFIPYHLTWINNKLVVDKQCTPDSSVIIGSEIIEINGLDARFIFNELLRRQVRDGYNETYPIWILNHFFREYYSYIFGHPETFKIKYKTTNGLEKTVLVDGLTKENMVCYLGSSLYPDLKKEKGVEYQFDESIKTGFLKVKSFDRSLYRKKFHQGYLREIRKAFYEIKRDNVETLVLDLRNNQGGNFEYGQFLLAYLLKEPFHLIERTNAVKGYNKNRLKKGICYGTKLTKIKRNAYHGKLYVLINGGCFSNCGIVVSDLSFYNRGILIGEETGGNKSVLSGQVGFEPITVLPNTSIHCDPVNHQIQINSKIENNGHGSMPNFLIIPTLNDIINNNDVVKNFVYKMILEGN
ncbi:MAG: S41 family peptidase [Flavobacteriia bacterium]|nr:S41 family peptidase [Flavobacteriia bacterium]